jgi:DNA-binding CsgD family transcriptional regulator
MAAIVPIQPREEQVSSGTELFPAAAPGLGEWRAESQRLRLELLKSSVEITLMVAALHETIPDNATLQLACLRVARKGYQTVLTMLESILASGIEPALFGSELDELYQALRDLGLFTIDPPHPHGGAARVESSEQAVLDPLTPRELDVLKCIAKGHSTKETAYLLGMSFKTAACHRYRLMDKLGIHDLANLVRYAIRKGLIEP